jgi:lipid A 4'-phosphatase
MFLIFNIAAFLLYPQIDIKFSNLFYRPGLGFIYKDNICLILIHRSIYIISYIIIAYLILSLLYNIITSKKLFGLFGKKDLIYVLLCLAIGPGLIVNYAFKDNIFGRARPCNIEEFGGDKNFTPIFTISDNCSKNCSFTSGHAALAFFLTSFAFVAKSRSRLIFISAMIFGVIVSMGRVIQGGHFLSDVIFSGIIVIAINMGIARLFACQEALLK